MQIVTITTDFGLKDGYVSVMKGIILGLNPDVKIIDISSTIDHQNVKEAAFVFGTSYSHFPKGTIHLVVVDPGVGSERRPLLISGMGYNFVGPDNGVFSYVIAEALEHLPNAVPCVADRVGALTLQPLPRGFTAISLTESRYWRNEVSTTFHGRDVFAPVVAHLSLGVDQESLGEPISRIMFDARSMPVEKSYRDHTKGICCVNVAGEVIHIDGFGNLITNIREVHIPNGRIRIAVGKHHLNGISSTYSEGNGTLAVLSSSGYLEIAEKNGDLASRIGACVGTPVSLETF